MDIAIIIVASILLLVGILGSFLPVLPGPPVSWLALLLVNFTDYGHFGSRFLLVTAIITVVVTIFDYILPGLAVKKRGGTKSGEKGATLGAIFGIFLGPAGIIIGPFAGAFIGELFANNFDVSASLRIAMSSFIGFLLSTGIKLIWCLIMTYWFVAEVVF